MGMGAGRTIFHTLNGMRGVAAIAVVLFHAEALAGTQLAPGGYLAVDLFFVLSGLVIAHAYEGRLLQTLTPIAFMRHRLIRFYPLYLLGLVLGAGLMTLEILVSPPAVLTPAQVTGATVAGLAFLPAPFGTSLYPLNVPAWSLLYELVVNALYAVWLVRLRTRALVGIAAVTFLGLAILILQRGSADAGADWQTAQVGLCRTLFAFTLGVVLFRCRNPRPLPGRYAMPLVAGVGVLLCLPVPAAMRPFFDLACIGALLPVAVALGARFRSSRLVAVFTWLGTISFPIYAIHYPVIQLGLALNNDFGQGPLILAGSLAGLLLVSTLAERWYDRPVRRVLDQWTRWRTPADG
jgi:peptidoglycan/LPS O-acetylase OafA/YrhL